MRYCAAPGCGKEIIFGQSAHSNALVPLEKCSHVYEIVAPAEGGKPPLVRQVLGGYVSHYLTCKSPEKFSKRAKAEDADIV